MFDSFQWTCFSLPNLGRILDLIHNSNCFAAYGMQIIK